MITKTIKAKGGEFAVEADGRLRAVETYYVKSTEEKPLEGVRDADRCVEKDTAKVFIFDAGDGAWIPFGG